GAAEARQMSFVFDAEVSETPVELDLQIDPHTSDVSGRGEQRGHLVGQVSCRDAAARRVAAIIAGEHSPAAEVRTDATGVFMLALPPGRYDLLVEVDRVLAVRSIEIP